MTQIYERKPTDQLRAMFCTRFKQLTEVLQEAEEIAAEILKRRKEHTRASEDRP